MLSDNFCFQYILCFFLFYRIFFHQSNVLFTSCFVKNNSDTMIKNFSLPVWQLITHHISSPLKTWCTYFYSQALWGFIPFTRPISTCNWCDWTFNLRCKAIWSTPMIICRMGNLFSWPMRNTCLSRCSESPYCDQAGAVSFSEKDLEITWKTVSGCGLCSNTTFTHKQGKTRSCSSWAVKPK